MYCIMRAGVSVLVLPAAECVLICCCVETVAGPADVSPAWFGLPSLGGTTLRGSGDSPQLLSPLLHTLKSPDISDSTLCFSVRIVRCELYLILTGR